MTVSTEVFVDQPVPEEEADRIATEFAGIGLDADVRVAVPTRSLEAVALTIFATLAFQPFVSQLSSDFADDSYARLKVFVTKVLHRRRKHTDTDADAGDQDGGGGEDSDEPRRVLVLQDAVTGLRVVLEPDLPAESYRQLLSLDLTKFTHGPLHYDPARARWRSELDEQH